VSLYLRVGLSSTCSSQAIVCFIQLVSSLSGKSSLACAPLDSFLYSAAFTVIFACKSKFSSSNASIKSVFQIFPLSVIPMCLYIYEISSNFVQPSSSKSYFLKTAACLCIVFYIANLILAVDSVPLEYLILSKFAIVYSPESLGNSLCF